MTLIDDLITLLQNDEEERRKFVKNIFRPALQFVENEERQQVEAERQANINTALSWWTNTVLPLLNNPITTRDEAKQNYLDIENGIKNQTDGWRLYILRQKLEDANNNFKLAKKLVQQNQPINIVVT